MTASDPVLAAVDALRRADDLAAPSLRRHWAAVSSYVATVVGPDADARQAALVRVLRSIRRVSGRSAPEVRRWLRTVALHSEVDRGRSRKRDLVARALRDRPRDPDAAEPVDGVAADGPRGGAPELAAFLERVLDGVDRWLVQRGVRPEKRFGDHRRAAIALRYHVLGDGLGELLADLDGVERTTLMKWIERGREEVLLPWLGAAGAELHAEDAVAALAEILERARRSDAGQPRPARRSVSPTVPRAPSHPPPTSGKKPPR